MKINPFKVNYPKSVKPVSARAFRKQRREQEERVLRLLKK